MNITQKIRRAIADNKARQARNEHLAAIKSRIHKQQKNHGPTRHLHAEAYRLTHEALRNG